MWILVHSEIADLKQSLAIGRGVADQVPCADQFLQQCIDVHIIARADLHLDLLGVILEPTLAISHHPQTWA